VAKPPRSLMCFHQRKVVNTRRELRRT
jgi:hypothetical protein